MTCSIPGCQSDQRGARGLCNKHYLALRRFGDPLAGRTIRPRGTGTINSGYMYRTENGDRKMEHVRIAERALGHELPPGAQVHHVDEDKTNNTPTNLVICPDQAYHSLLHLRKRAMDACGNPNYRKCLICGVYEDPAGMGFTGGSFYHYQCRRDRDASRSSK